MRQKGQVTLPKEVREALKVKEGDYVRFNIHEDGEVTMEGMAMVSADQRWFWTPEWQAGEREADEQIAAGGGKVFHDLDEMFEYLNRER
ncbi:AbrB/MazE/SpoVT family DNA-binding domain-containing protein [Glycomyces buryatensis]|uniref:AbrB/MazE/SpoVT family DNA-binding domain-containing protein n=1 Tax=Glycomyces buryatensis TaxID=2570927 RepID=A0A4S8PW75_9ACTN|nr:AbrB/MazE/SpoVT family DNA-binding domain-containing protein [Glycomyces buryatensis]